MVGLYKQLHEMQSTSNPASGYMQQSATQLTQLEGNTSMFLTKAHYDSGGAKQASGCMPWHLDCFRVGMAWETTLAGEQCAPRSHLQPRPGKWLTSWVHPEGQVREQGVTFS